MVESPFHTRCPGACALFSWQEGRWCLRPEYPETMSGHQWFRFLVGLDATDEPLTVDLRWPPKLANVGGDYDANDSFAVVLDRACYLDHGDGHWQRLDGVELAEDGARVTIPAGGAGRRFAVGMPVTAHDLHCCLGAAQASPHARVEQIGFATRGSPLWCIETAASDQAQGTIVVQALQHAQEWAGLRVVQGLLRLLLSDAGKALRQRWQWIIYPATNADAIYQGWRGDPMAVDDYNPNRDWGIFRLAETSCVAKHLQGRLAHCPPLAHAIDLHMGWNWRSDPGSAVAVGIRGAYPDALIDWQEGFAHALFAAEPFSSFLWASGQPERNNFVSWIERTFAVPGQTLEFSRHWWGGEDGAPPSEADEERFGHALAHALDSYLQAQPWSAATAG